MGTLDYRRHFILLGGCSVALVFEALFPSPFVYDRFHFLFGLSGTLHAFAVVVALQAKTSRPWRVGFVAAAAALSILTGLGGVELTVLFRLDPVATIFLALALISAIGSLFYWLLIRFMWARFLPLRSLLLSVGSCASATLVASLVTSAVPSLHDALLPMSWWFAFSTSLWIADRNNMAAYK